MHEIARRAADALHTHPHPALRLSELLELLTETDRGLSADRLRLILEGRPEEFRVIEPWRGPWRMRPGRENDPWVVALSRPPHADRSRRPVLCLRESVRWLGRSVDDRSRVELSRWLAIVLSERASRRAISRRLHDDQVA